MFELKRGTAELKGTCYFEFVKNSDKKKPCWNEDAYYLEQELFSFFYPVFRKASDRFDWYAFNKLNQSEIKSLLNGLSVLESQLKEIKDKEQFKVFFEKIYYWIETDGNPDNWENYIETFTRNCKRIRELSFECLEEKQVLWVLGI